LLRKRHGKRVGTQQLKGGGKKEKRRFVLTVDKTGREGKMHYTVVPAGGERVEKRLKRGSGWGGQIHGQLSQGSKVLIEMELRLKGERKTRQSMEPGWELGGFLKRKEGKKYKICLKQKSRGTRRWEKKNNRTSRGEKTSRHMST